MQQLFVFLTLALALLPAAATAVLFSEVAANPLGADDGREWVEFYAEEETDMTGWKLVENGVEHKLSLFRGNETVPSGAYFIIADDAAAFANESGFNGTLFDSAFSLSNAGELLVLKNATYNASLAYNETPEGQTFCFLNSTWTVCASTPGFASVSIAVVNNSSNATIANDTQDSLDKPNPLNVLSYPKKFAFGSNGFIGVDVQTTPSYVYAYGYPKKVLMDSGAAGFDGPTSVFVQTNGNALVPFRTKDNCDSQYEDGQYRVRVRLADAQGDEIETADVFLELYGAGEDCDVSGADEQETENAEPKVYVVDAPENATLGSNITVKIVAMGSGAFEIYSYLRDGKSVASSGGWKGNVRKINATEITYAELFNTPVKTGELVLVVRLKDGNKTYDASKSVFVYEDSNITETQEEPKRSEQDDFAEYKTPLPAPAKKTGVWESFINALRGWLR
ncbi:MAG: lamin tail domain-containing protein [Candidatus Aenigmatarchaeota archaeon]|nr:MAG: lamin tail domain-containing protein [Candidatus Aenigmarchaeota archaeon]